MNELNELLAKLKDYVGGNKNQNEVEDLYSQSKDSLERETFMLILTNELNEEEKDLYKDLLDIEGVVDGFGFLSGIRGQEEAEKLILSYFKKVLNNFISN